VWGGIHPTWQQWVLIRWLSTDAPSLPPPTPNPQAYIDALKEPFCLAERAILFVVGFTFGIGDPYPHVAKQLRALGLSDERDRNAKIEIQQMAWNFLRDRCAVAVGCLSFCWCSGCRGG
jgi:hypothetical protein